MSTPITYPTRVQVTPRGENRLPYRKITLKNIKTGRVVSAPSIAAFARRMKWGPNGQFHFDNVLKGHRLQHRGWGMRSILNKKLALKDVFGNQYKATIAEVANKIGSIAANKLRRQGAAGALVLASRDLTHVLTPKTYRVRGYVFRVGSRYIRLTHLTEAYKLGISVTQAFNLCHGYVTTAGNVTFVRAHTTQRRATEALETVEA